ncbi:MAG: mycofactocin precursor [Chloroflexi bacterium RBG_13_51_18]|nr:MAG: mycofactocin precursor [Chloroflexi bacterium RBG_13_51_18]
MDKAITAAPDNQTKTDDEPQIIEEITIEELSIDGICGVY